MMIKPVQAMPIFRPMCGSREVAWTGLLIKVAHIDIGFMGAKGLNDGRRFA
jgi:hypothetical protein